MLTVIEGCIFMYQVLQAIFSETRFPKSFLLPFALGSQ